MSRLALLNRPRLGLFVAISLDFDDLLNRVQAGLRLFPVFTGRVPGPAMKRARKITAVGKAEQVRDFADRDIRLLHVLLRELASRPVEQLLVRRAGVGKPIMQRPHAHVQRARNFCLAAVAGGQQFDEFRVCLCNNVGFVQACKKLHHGLVVLASKLRVRGR